MEIERLARASAEALGLDWEPMNALERATYAKQVRAVLQAMREPTEGMLDAGDRLSSHQTTEHGFVTAADVWQAMIDKALEP